MDLPDTTARRSPKKPASWPILALVAAIVGVSALLLAGLVGQRGFSPGEDITSGSVQGVSASLEDTAYPPRDILVFEGGATTVYVYLSVSDLDPDADLAAEVSRASNESLFGWVSRSGPDIEVAGGGEDQLAPSEGGVSGVVKLEVRAEDGGKLPLGDYTVRVREDGETAVEKRFVVRA